MAGGGGGEQDLNLVPYLDIMVNLIMFMLTVTAYLVELREAPVLVPAYTTGSGAGSTEKQKPYLTVAISTRSFAILGSTDEIPADELPKDGDSYPIGRLTEKLREYKSQYELGETLILTADGSVPYTILVATMDAARSDDRGPLFPGITLAQAVQGQ
jgi:biopolymer transport protein TolR